MLLANKLFISVLLPMPKGMFQKKEWNWHTKRLSLIIHSSQIAHIYIFFSSDGIRVFLKIKKKRKTKTKPGGASQYPLASYLLKRVKPRNWTQVVMWYHGKNIEGKLALLLIWCVALGKLLNLSGLFSFFSKWGKENFDYLKLRVFSGLSERKNINMLWNACY